jgi:predicted alpha/beta-hydrolase family hydrolase
MHTPVIATVAERLAGQGFATLRFNFPYREKGKKSPDPPARLEHAWRCAWQTLKCNPHFPVDRMVAAGKSMGGRIASQMLADDELNAVGLILLGYPLHAPGRTDRLRDAHLYRIRAPILFFAGTRDTLCDLERLDRVLTNLKAPHELAIVEGGNHSFALPKSANRSEANVIEDIAHRCVKWLEPFR